MYDVEIVGNFYEDPSIFGINREKPKDQLLLSFDHCDMAEGKDHCCVMVGKIEKGGDVTVINGLYDEEARELYNKLVPKR